jgi:hypothetical protein
MNSYCQADGERNRLAPTERRMQHLKPFLPSTLPPNTINWIDLLPLIGEANRAVARYDGLLQNLVNPDVLLFPLRTQEAVQSSRIEGTQASLRDVLEYEADARPDAPSPEADIQEVISYRNALQIAIDSLESRPLSLNLIRNIHLAVDNSLPSMSFLNCGTLWDNRQSIQFCCSHMDSKLSSCALFPNSDQLIRFPDRFRSQILAVSRPRQ